MSGQCQERKVSLKYRHKTAILVSELLLRRIGAGQIDFCYIDDGALVIVEVKSSMTGKMAYKGKQQQRLARSAQFLSGISNLSCQIILTD